MGREGGREGGKEGGRFQATRNILGYTSWIEMTQRTFKKLTKLL